MKKAAKEEKERFDAYMEEYKKLQKEEDERFKKAQVEYDAKMIKYKEYQDHVRNWGESTNKRTREKFKNEPKKPERKEVFVPNARHRFGMHFDGGRRRTRRGRKSRSTRRR